MAQSKQTNQAQSKQKTVKVRINCRYGRFNPGEVVEIPADRAETILGLGWGEEIKRDK